MTSEKFDYEKELEAAAIREMEAKYAAMKLEYDNDFIGERDEVITRGLRDRSPTTRTRSASTLPTSGVRDALPFGCRRGLLLFPPKKSSIAGPQVVIRASADNLMQRSGDRRGETSASGRRGAPNTRFTKRTHITNEINMQSARFGALRWDERGGEPLAEGSRISSEQSMTETREAHRAIDRPSHRKTPRGDQICIYHCE